MFQVQTQLIGRRARSVYQFRAVSMFERCSITISRLMLLLLLLNCRFCCCFCTQIAIKQFNALRSGQFQGQLCCGCLNCSYARACAQKECNHLNSGIDTYTRCCRVAQSPVRFAVSAHARSVPARRPAAHKMYPFQVRQCSSLRLRR